MDCELTHHNDGHMRDVWIRLLGKFLFEPYCGHHLSSEDSPQRQESPMLLLAAAVSQDG